MTEEKFYFPRKTLHLNEAHTNREALRAPGKKQSISHNKSYFWGLKEVQISVCRNFHVRLMFTKALKEQSICITEVTWEVEKKFKFDFIFFFKVMRICDHVTCTIKQTGIIE